MLWYLHLCTLSHITVIAYQDAASGTMRENDDGSGEFVRALLRPRVEISAGDKAKALALHHEAHHMCFIARSVNFPVDVEPEIIEAEKVPAVPRVESPN